MEKNTMKYEASVTLSVQYELTSDLMQEIRDSYDTNFPTEEMVLEFLRDRFVGNGTYDTVATETSYYWGWV